MRTSTDTDVVNARENLKGSKYMEFDNDIIMDVTPEETGLIATDERQVDIIRETMNMDKIMQWSEMLSKSTIVPITYQNRPENCFIALDMATRMGISPMVVMQNLYVIQGKPSWAGQAVASLIRSNPTLTDVQLHYVGEEGKDSWGAYVTAKRVKTGEIVKGGTVTIKIAKLEGWYQKRESKWQTMPELMLAYRAYSWFGRVHCPETMMGLQSVEETEDITNKVAEKRKVENPFEKAGS